MLFDKAAGQKCRQPLNTGMNPQIMAADWLVVFRRLMVAVCCQRIHEHTGAIY